MLNETQLKSKFKLEEKEHPHLIEAALRGENSFDSSKYQDIINKLNAASTLKKQAAKNEKPAS